MPLLPWLAAVWGLLVWGNWYRTNCAIDHPGWLDHVRQSLILWSYIDARSIGAWAANLGWMALVVGLAVSAAGAGRIALRWTGSGSRRRGIIDAVAFGAGLAGIGLLGAGFGGLCGLLPVAAAAAAGLVAGLPEARRAFRGGWTGLRSADRATRWLMAGLAAAIAIPLLGALAPETSVDAQLHHLAQPALFAAQGRITALPWNEFSLHPGLVHMQFLAAYVLGGEHPAKLVHFGWGILAAALVAGLAARRLGIRWGLAAAAAFVLMPYTQVVAMRAYVELALAVYMTLLLRDLVQPGANPVVVGLWCGFCAGTKVNGLMAPAIAAVALLGRRSAARGLAGWAAAGFLVAVPWMARNWLSCGNPAAPFLPRLFPTLWYGPASYARHLADLAPANNEPGSLGGLLGLLARPWNVGISNVGVMDPHSGMGGWFLWAAPACLFVAGMGRLAALVGLGLILWQMMPHLVRYSMPLWPAMAVLGAHGVREIADLGRGGRAVVAAAGIVLAFHLPLAVAREFSLANPFGVVFGLESRDHYLARGFPERGRTIAAGKWLEPELGSSKALLLTPTGLWLFWGPRVVVQSLFDTPLPERFARESVGSRGIANRFRQLGIGWTIYLPQSGWALESTYGTWDFDPGAAARWRAFWETRAIPAHAEGDRIVIHRLDLGAAPSPTKKTDGWLPGLDEQWLAGGADPEQVARATGSAAAWEQTGAAILQSGDEKAALAAFREAAKRGRRTVVTMSAIGMLEARAGRLSASLEPLETALVLDPRREDIRVLAVHALLGLKRPQDAARVLDDGLKLNPGSQMLGSEWRMLTGRPYLR